MCLLRSFPHIDPECTEDLASLDTSEPCGRLEACSEPDMDFTSYQNLGRADALKEFVEDLVSLKLDNKRLPSDLCLGASRSIASADFAVHPVGHL